MRPESQNAERQRRIEAHAARVVADLDAAGRRPRVLRVRPRCPGCGGTRLRRLRKRDHGATVERDVRCRSCNLLFVEVEQ